MARHYSTRTFFRQMPDELLARYFGRRARSSRYPAPDQRPGLPVHRPGVPHRRYVGLRRVGAVRCLTPEPGLFSAVAFELDGVHRIFTTLPVVPVVEVP